MGVQSCDDSSRAGNIRCHLCAQVTSVSALNLHVINVLCFALIEAYAWMEFGSGAIMKRGVSHVLLLLLTCAVLPFAANVFGEVKSRRAFLHRQGSA